MVVAVGSSLVRTPVYMPRMCRCGGGLTRNGGRGRLCECCVAEREASKLCYGCGRGKPPGRGQVYCTTCEPVRPPRGTYRPCPKCGSRDKLRPSHHLCAECMEVEREASEARRRAKGSLKRKACWGCGRPKGPGRRHYCDPCQRRRNPVRTCQDCPEPVGPRRKLCDPCRDRKIRERRAANKRAINADPGLREEYLRYFRDYYARQVMKKSRKTARSPQPSITVRSRPLAAAVYLAAARLGGIEDPTASIQVVAERVKVDQRSFRAWRREDRNVRVEILDRVLIRMDWTWWDVYDPERFPDLYSPLEWIDVVDQACYAWTGERCLAE